MEAKGTEKKIGGIKIHLMKRNARKYNRKMEVKGVGEANAEQPIRKVINRGTNRKRKKTNK